MYFSKILVLWFLLLPSYDLFLILSIKVEIINSTLWDFRKSTKVYLQWCPQYTFSLIGFDNTMKLKWKTYIKFWKPRYIFPRIYKNKQVFQIKSRKVEESCYVFVSLCKICENMGFPWPRIFPYMDRIVDSVQENTGQWKHFFTKIHFFSVRIIIS